MNKIDKKKFITILILLITLIILNMKISLLGVIKNDFITLYSYLGKPFSSKCNFNINSYLNQDLKYEIKDLQKLVNINKSTTDFNYVNARVVFRNVDYWYNEITIDKGFKDGIKINDAVINGDGLVGKITKVYKNNSVVALLYNKISNYAVSVYIGSNRNSYGVLKNKQGLVVSGIDNMDNINKNDSVVTSGLGGIFPSGIYVGYVYKLGNKASRRVYVKSKVNFSNIKYVMVLLNK